MAEFITTENTPSKNRFYELRQRKLGLGELSQISANIKMGSKDEMLDVLKNTVDVEDWNEVCTGDLKNIIIWSRVLTLDESSLFAEFKCSDKKCGYHNLNEEIDLNVFQKHYIGDEIEEENEITLSDGTEVIISLEKIKHLSIQKQIKLKIKDADDKVVKISSLVNFKNKPMNTKTKYDFLNDPDNIDIALELDDYVTRKHFFGVYDLAFHKCPKCEEVSQVWLRFRHDFFTKLKFLRDS